MEAIERWTAHYPELEALSQALKSLHASVRAIGEPGEAPCAEEVRDTVRSEVGEFQELVEALAPEAERLRPELSNVPLSSLTALYVQLQSELQRCPEQSRSIGGPPLCESLREVLDSTGRTAAPAANDLLEAWVQEFLREPLEELYVHNGQALQFIQNSTATEQSLTRRIQELSEQICQRGFRPDRVELMDTRSLLVQQLLSSLGAKQRTAAGCEPRIEGVLRSKLQAFEEAHAASLKDRREEIARHRAISETLDRNVESLGRYMMQKERAREAQDSAAVAQREQRAAKVSRVAEVFQEAFSGVLAIIEECRRENMQRQRVHLEERIALEVGEEFSRRLRHFRDFHSAASAHSECSLGLELRFGSWLRQAYVAMQDKSNQVAGEIRSHVSSSRARMMALSSAGIAQVRAQREQMQQVVELTSKELGSCQETLALMEFSRPSSTEVAKGLRHFEQVQESARWQQREVERLQEIEQRIRQDTDGVVAEARPLESEATNEERWSRLLSEAEGWVAGFFYTWQRDLPALGAPRADETDQQELSLSAFAIDTSRRMWRPSPAKQTPESTEGSAPQQERLLPGDLLEALKSGQGRGRSWRTDPTQASAPFPASASAHGGREQVGGSQSSGAGCSRGRHDSPGSARGAAASGVATYCGEAGYGCTSENGSPVKLTLSEISQCISEGSTNTTTAVSLMALSADPTGSREGTGSVVIPPGSALMDLSSRPRRDGTVLGRHPCSDVETEVASTPSTQLAASTGIPSPPVPAVPFGMMVPGAISSSATLVASGTVTPQVPTAAAAAAHSWAPAGTCATGHPSTASASASSSTAVVGGGAAGLAKVDGLSSTAPLTAVQGIKDVPSLPASSARECCLTMPLSISARSNAGKRSNSALSPSWPVGGHSGSFCPPSTSRRPRSAALFDSMGHPNALGPSLLGPSCIAGQQAAGSMLGGTTAWLGPAAGGSAPCSAVAPSRPASVPPGGRRAAASPRGPVAFVPVEVVRAGREVPPMFVTLQHSGGPLAAGPFAGGNPRGGSSITTQPLSRSSSMGASMRAFSAADLHQRVRSLG